MTSRHERRLMASLSQLPIDRLEALCRSDHHRDKFSQLDDDRFHDLIRKEYPRFLALKTICRDFTHPRFVAPSPLIGSVWKIHVVDEDDYELVCRSIHEGQWFGLEDGGGQRRPEADADDAELPGKFRLILYPQPEHKSEETKWTRKAIAMTRRLYRLYFNEPPPMDIWCDALLPHNDLAALQRPTPPPVLEASIDRRARIDSEPTRTMVIDPTLQSTSQGHLQHHHHRYHSQRKVPTVIKKELPDENSPLRKRCRSPTTTGDATSTPLRRTTIDSSRPGNFFPPKEADGNATQTTSSATSASSGGRRITVSGSSKRPHSAAHNNSWPAISPYGLYRPALRRRRISHEGLLLIVPIMNSSTSSKSSARGTAESYGVDTPFQVYMSVFDTVRQLKEKIWSEKGVPVNRQVIWISDNAVMNETQKLGDLGVAVGDLDDGLGSNSEGKDVIGLQVIKDVKNEPEDKPPRNEGSPLVSNSNNESKTT